MKRTITLLLALTLATSVLASNTKHKAVPVVGHRKTKVYHRVDCPSYSRVSPKNRVTFASPAVAERAGFRLAANCPG